MPEPREERSGKSQHSHGSQSRSIWSYIPRPLTVPDLVIPTSTGFDEAKFSPSKHSARKAKKIRQHARKAQYEEDDAYVYVEDEQILYLVPSPSGIWSRMSKRARRNTILAGFFCLYVALFEYPRLLRNFDWKRESSEKSLRNVSERFNSPKPPPQPKEILRRIAASNKKIEEDSKPVNYGLKALEENTKAAAKAKATKAPVAEATGVLEGSARSANTTSAEEPKRKKRQKRRRRKKKKGKTSSGAEAGQIADPSASSAAVAASEATAR